MSPVTFFDEAKALLRARMAASGFVSDFFPMLLDISARDGRFRVAAA